MLTRLYLPQILTALFGGLFIAIGILTFGKPEYFDRLFIGVLLFTGIICRKDINIISLLAIILIQRVLQEVAWIGLSNSTELKEVMYIATLVIYYQLRFDPLVKFSFPIIVLIIGSEFYWYFTNYPAPQLYWHLALLLSCLVTRYMVFSRLTFVEHFFPNKSKSTNLDWIFYKIAGTTAIILLASLLEYLIRHDLGQSQVLLVYTAYPYFVHTIAVFSIWATFNESYKQLIPKLLRA